MTSPFVKRVRTMLVSSEDDIDAAHANGYSDGYDARSLEIAQSGATPQERDVIKAAQALIFAKTIADFELALDDLETAVVIVYKG